MLLKLTIYKAELYKCKYIIELFKLLNWVRLNIFKMLCHTRCITLHTYSINEFTKG